MPMEKRYKTMNSILETTKYLLGIMPSDTSFDNILVVHINSVFSVLAQLGVGPTNGFSITGGTEGWTDFLPEGNRLEIVKSYMAMKVRLAFDPPQNGTFMEALKQQIAEMEWRINVQVDPGDLP